MRGVAGRLEHSREKSERGEKTISARRENARRRALGGSAAERGKEEGRGGPGRGSATRRAGARGVRSRPAGGAGSSPCAARARRAPRAHARSVGGSAGERADRWAGTVTAAVSLTGGAGLSAARGERGAGASARARVGRPERRKEIGPPDCTVPFWNCLNYFE